LARNDFLRIFQGFDTKSHADIKKRMPCGTRFLPDFAEPGKLFSGFSGHCWCVRVAPADFVALGSGTQLALLALGWCLKCAAAAHFFEDTLGIKLGLEAFQSTVNGLAFFHNHSTHAMIFGWLVWFRSFFGAR
jgi:hypothetical protein